MMTIDELLKTKKVLICCGAGGVGKTTLSAALGVRAAQLGLNVLVLTIDPARRLATSLGVNALNDVETEVATGQFSGHLFAAMLDMKKTFDEFIVRLAPSEAVAERVLKNNIYQQISTALNASQEYTALERLFQATSSQKYDLVVLDTPPTKHAIDFLNAPVKIHALFQETIIKWFLMPLATLDRLGLGLMNRGTKAAFRAVEKIAGADFLFSITEFFAMIRDWQKVLRDRSAEVQRLLTSSQTGFVLITGFNAVRIEEARFFERSLKRGGYFLSAIIVNRAFPLWGQKEIGQESFTIDDPSQNANYQRLKKYYDQLKEYYQEQQDAFKNFAGEMRQNVAFVRLPDFDQDIHEVKNLERIAERLAESDQGVTS